MLSQEKHTTDVIRLLSQYDQEQLLRFYNQLGNVERQTLFDEISKCDFEKIAKAIERKENRNIMNCSPCDVVDVATASENYERWDKIGRDIIANGKVAIVILAGGRGSRLGINYPKGMYDIGITHNLYLIQILIQNIHERCKETGIWIPVYIMTNESSQNTLIQFFKQHEYWGYNRKYIYFFNQKMVPVINAYGKIQLKDKNHICFAPNGNGGWYESLKECGQFTEIMNKKIEWINVLSVDNPLYCVVDPVFIGCLVESKKDLGIKVVEKKYPEEKMGNLCMCNGRPAIVEYYEMTEEMANKRNQNGEFLYKYGVILNYMYNVSKLGLLDQENLPLHFAKKKMEHLNGEDRSQEDTYGDVYIMETLAADHVYQIGNVLALETKRDKEFAPIKNRDGVDSPTTARRMLVQNGYIL